MSDYIGRCSAGHTVRTTSEDVNRGGGWVSCPCGRLTTPKALKAKAGNRKCNATCTSSTSPNCSCKCAGANHGTGNIYRG